MKDKKVNKKQLWKLMSEEGLLQLHAEAVLKGRCSLAEARQRTRLHKEKLLGHLMSNAGSAHS